MSTGRFRARPTRAAGVLRHGGWQMKWYEITFAAGPVDPITSAAAIAQVERCLPASDRGVGFVVVHCGAESVWLLVDTWDAEIVSQRTFRAALDDPTSFVAVPFGGPTACVWELTVHAHERDAYVRHVLDPPDGPDIDAYLADVVRAPDCEPHDLVRRFEHAWAAGDIDALMALMSDEPRYRASTGDGPGVEYVGVKAVREGFASVIAAESAGFQRARFHSDVLVEGNRAVSFWSYPTVGPDNASRTVDGVDVWAIDDGRFAVKDVYRKAFPDPS